MASALSAGASSGDRLISWRQRDRVGRWELRRHAHRRGVGAAEHSPEAAGAPRPTPDRDRHGADRHQEFRGRRYLGPRGPPRRGSPRSDGRHATPPSPPPPGVDGRRAPHGAGRRAMVSALEETLCPADDLAILFTSGPRGPQGCHPHTRGCDRASRPDWPALRRSGRAALHPNALLLDRGIRRGCSRRLVAGATLLTEAVPDAGHTLDFSSREKVTLFRGWPDQAARLAGHPRFATADLTILGPAASQRCLPPPAARARGEGQPVRHDRDVRSLLRRPPRHDLPPGKHGSCGRLFEGVDVRIFDPTPDEASPRL